MCRKEKEEGESMERKQKKLSGKYAVLPFSARRTRKELIFLTYKTKVKEREKKKQVRNTTLSAFMMQHISAYFRQAQQREREKEREKEFV